MYFHQVAHKLIALGERKSISKCLWDISLTNLDYLILANKTNYVESIGQVGEAIMR